MEQFLVVATVHLLALLSPGPDFFLVARTAVAQGWRIATGACVGIALGNGVFIAAAFAGVAALRPGSGGFIAVQVAGSCFLVYMGVMFLRHAGSSNAASLGSEAPSATVSTRRSWWNAAAMGLLSALLNPKNALFYAALAAMLEGPATPTANKLFYAGWMFTVVLGWDLLVAALIGHPAVLRRFARALPWLERGTGVVLLGLGVSILLSLAWPHM
jgi:threonine/homoserine/homoserine lactone efflux protein